MTSEQADFLESLPRKWDRVERAILGDPSVGHVGLVTRMERVEDVHLKIPDRHAEIDQRRVDGDRRLHGRIDDGEDETRECLAAIEKKLDKSIWLTMGAFLGGIGAGYGLGSIGPLIGS